MNVLETVIKNLVDTKYENLPPDAIKETKKQILDTLAVTIAGGSCSISTEIKGLIAMVKEWGGKPESTILSFGGLVPAPNAAFINGTLSVRLDFDDTQVNSIHIHPSRAIIPTAFAVAESCQNISGKNIITAIALGHDLEIRLKQAVGRDCESPFGVSTDFLSAAATAGKVINHNYEKMKHALGLSLLQTSGNMLGTNDANAKGLITGFACRAGIVSAQLAAKDFIFKSDYLDPNNNKNFYQKFYDGQYWPWLLVSDLGKVFMGTLTSQKQFPCCHGQHTAIQAFLHLIKDQNIKIDDVEEIVLNVAPFDYGLLCYPVETKRNPQNVIETQFSLYWGIASALVYGKVNINNFSEDALQDPVIKGIANKIIARPDRDVAQQGFTRTIVEIKLKNGTSYKEQIKSLYGTPENPMSFSDIVKKFQYCCTYSVKPISNKNQNQVIEMIENLEEINDVAKIIQLLA